MSPTTAAIFSLYSVMFMSTVALPLSAGSVMVHLSFFSSFRAVLSPLLMFGLGSFAHLMVRTTSHLSSSALVSVICFVTVSVPAMSSLTGMAVGVMTKFRPLVRMDRSSSLIYLSLRLTTHLFVSVMVSVTEVDYPPLCVSDGVCH